MTCSMKTSIINGTQVTILGVVVVILVHEYRKSKAESDQVSWKGFYVLSMNDHLDFWQSLVV